MTLWLTLVDLSSSPGKSNISSNLSWNRYQTMKTNVSWVGKKSTTCFFMMSGQFRNLTMFSFLLKGSQSRAKWSLLMRHAINTLSMFFLSFKRFSESGEMVPLNETPLYTEDWIGLKAIDEVFFLIYLIDLSWINLIGSPFL